jgi:TPR repeat protein
MKKGGKQMSNEYTDSHAQIKERIEAAIKKAEKGHIKTMRTLAYMYAKGEYLPKDSLAAQAWYRKAAELGDESSRKKLAELLTFSQGVAQNYDEAFNIYHDFMLDCDLDGMEAVGIAYKLGRGIEQDEEQGSFFIRQAFDIELDLMNSADREKKEKRKRKRNDNERKK